jgi:hypothetical protein
VIFVATEEDIMLNMAARMVEERMLLSGNLIVLCESRW